MIARYFYAFVSLLALFSVDTLPDLPPDLPPDIRSEIDAFADRVEPTREAEIDRITAKLKAEIKRRVGSKSDREAKARNIANLTTYLDRLKSRVVLPIPTIQIGAAKRGDIGRLLIVGTVRQVIDGDVIAAVHTGTEKTDIVFRGLDVSELVDGAELQVVCLMEHIGPQQLTTASGGVRTLTAFCRPRFADALEAWERTRINAFEAAKKK